MCIMSDRRSSYNDSANLIIEKIIYLSTCLELIEMSKSYFEILQSESDLCSQIFNTFKISARCKTVVQPMLVRQR